MTELGTATPPDHADDRDVIDVLTTDHREFLSLISQIRSTADPEQRRDLADQLIAEVVRHAVGEEMFVYPAIRDHVPGGAEAVEHDTSEHAEMERTMKQLESTDSAGPEFLTVVDSMEALLSAHVAAEEGEQLPQLRQHVPAEQLVELKGEVEAAKAAAPTRPHPLSPNAELFHKTVGPGVGMVDRLRDKLTGRST
jgi:hemerythrin-like domain-containing protein